jgi:purine nucleosidase
MDNRFSRRVLLSMIFAAFLMTSMNSYSANRTRVILDTDANNELDDQHAIAYLLFNGDAFDVEGITVNRTYNGGEVQKHFEEADRVVRLCGLHGKVRVYTGANGEFEGIRNRLRDTSFDGAEAVNFIIERAHAVSGEPLVLLPVGKLTNVALALEKDPSITKKIRIVWLGSNYPEPGEYNQDNDIPSLNYILDTDVPFEIVTVRYGKPSGTDAVRASLDEIKARMPGTGPRIEHPVGGRHGGEFATFGDYSVDLFKNIDLHGDPPSRALFDMAAVAIVKNGSWAQARTIPAPTLVEGKWQERPANQRKIIIWENFDKQKIMKDFYQTMAKPQLVQ